ENWSVTLEQLLIARVRRGELLVGKLAPYRVVTFTEMLAIVLLMVTVFRVPIHGALPTLLAIALPFVLTMLGLGLLISTRASTENASMQLVLGTVIPSIFLSGYVFPIESMPWVFQKVALAVPTTWLIDASRGVILRGAGWRELWPHAAVLWGMAAGVLTVSALRFHKKIG